MVDFYTNMNKIYYIVTVGTFAVDLAVGQENVFLRYVDRAVGQENVFLSTYYL